MAKDTPRHKYSIVACVRWEEADIAEWVHYHQMIGFDHIYLYSNDTDPLPTHKALLPYLRAARKQGFSTIVEVFAPAMAAMAAPVRAAGGQVVGVVTIAGPLVRLTEERMAALGPRLIATADEVAEISNVSPLFRNKAA